MLDTHARKYVQPSIEYTSKRLTRLGLSANQVTVIAFLLGIIAAGVYAVGYPILGVVLLWVSGFLDAVDGTMARQTKPSAFGTVMDITFDRIVEIAIIFAVAYLHPEAMWPLLLLSGSIIFSMTVFLTVGAISEKQGIKSFYYQAGAAERTEGFILFSIMMLFPSIVGWTTLLFFVIEVYTAIQRFMEAKKILS
ncbi:CDP-alcohol phosphatidyltransferase [Pontibacillus halophilus JSM 076056 = DSM 19796]|uniref:CDP-alcohol phosphatidyltransferase n=1 Tax=Pontibacillus halophilus JSM 076056 = DSM 19796 TaxID=1385510 RepID=A0A0A5GHH3_9BACI|nr:CDP-alcohol phosphatidyltransferase family protein [Pontibacillus halophilus]KGX90535.1 CDP-alcohol phosphatidyltransferase [Pontibacillus halophilus JSM 076056 = DSM 19796]